MSVVVDDDDDDNDEFASLYCRPYILQNGLRDLAMLKLGLGLGFGSRLGPGWLGLGSGLGRQFANCTCAILKLRSALCRMHRLTNHEQFTEATNAQTYNSVSKNKLLCNWNDSSKSQTGYFFC